MSEFSVQPLLQTPTVVIRDIYCQGSHSQMGAEESTATTQLVFPYRGVYVRHLGSDQAVAEAAERVVRMLDGRIAPGQPASKLAAGLTVPAQAG